MLVSYLNRSRGQCWEEKRERVKSATLCCPTTLLAENGHGSLLLTQRPGVEEQECPGHVGVAIE